MGLLDELPKSADEMLAHAKGGAAILEDFFARNPASPGVEAIRRRFLEGDTAGTILGLEKKHREAILRQGLQYLQLNRIDEAHEWLTFAVVVDPLEERAIYGLGVIAKLRGDLKTAVRCFVQFQALDATNPEGLLRLGECLLANRELTEAADCFKGAIALCEAGHGKPEQRDHARRMLAIATGVAEAPAA